MTNWVLILIFTGGANSSSPATTSVEFLDKESCQAAYVAVKQQVEERNKTDPNNLYVKGFCVKKGIRQ